MLSSLAIGNFTTHRATYANGFLWDSTELVKEMSVPRLMMECLPDPELNTLYSQVLPRPESKTRSIVMVIDADCSLSWR